MDAVTLFLLTLALTRPNICPTTERGTVGVGRVGPSFVYFGASHPPEADKHPVAIQAAETSGASEGVQAFIEEISKEMSRQALEVQHDKQEERRQNHD